MYSTVSFMDTCIRTIYFSVRLDRQILEGFFLVEKDVLYMLQTLNHFSLEEYSIQERGKHRASTILNGISLSSTIDVVLYVCPLPCLYPCPSIFFNTTSAVVYFDFNFAFKDGGPVNAHYTVFKLYGLPRIQA